MNKNTGQINPRKKRVLLDNGTWGYFEGERQKIAHKSPEEKIQERKLAEEKGKVLEDGSIEMEEESKEVEESGLSESDREKIMLGMSIPEMKSLAKKHGIKIPSKMRKADDIREFLVNGESEEDSL